MREVKHEGVVIQDVTEVKKAQEHFISKIINSDQITFVLPPGTSHRRNSSM